MWKQVVELFQRIFLKKAPVVPFTSLSPITDKPLAEPDVGNEASVIGSKGFVVEPNVFERAVQPIVVEPVVEEPVVVEPVVVEPVVVEPVVVEPVVVEPVIVEPVVVEPVVVEPVVVEPVVESEVPVVESEVPVVEEPVVESEVPVVITTDVYDIPVHETYAYGTADPEIPYPIEDIEKTA
jgi:hypothetical protein